jgi:NADH-quinone oxidoreductase subunit G/NADP-reducing hydrogenase subunit HndD
MKFHIEINGARVEAQSGETILDTLKRSGIQIPTLCHMKNFIPTGTCRICVVEDMNSGKLIPACSFPVTEGMKLLTHSSRVIESRKTIVELLLSNHPDDCLYCVRSKNCELQSLAKEHHVVERRIRGQKNGHKMDHSGTSIVRDPDKCILCGRCVRICEETMGVSAIDFINRGSKTIIGTTFNRGLNTSSCVNCGQCIMVCPTGALSEKTNITQVQAAFTDPNKHMVAQYAPSITISLAEEFGLPAGTDMNGVLNAALRRMGFKNVFDTSFSADLTIMEEASELIQRVVTGGKLPMITSCCPAWIKYAETFADDFIPNLSTCKSPQQMMGAVIKSFFAETAGLKPENIFSVSIMPCTAKKFECERDTMGREGVNDVDVVLTTRELIDMIKWYGIDLRTIRPELPDSPLSIRSSAGKAFGASGGVMQAAIRTAYKKLTGNELVRYKVEEVWGMQGRKEAKIRVNENLELGVAVVSGLSNAKALLDEIRNGRSDIHFIEVMTCPGGCIAGGGQRIGSQIEEIKSRVDALDEIDEKESLKVSHRNPEIIQLYEKYLGEPLGHKSHELLHTHYNKRNTIK